MVDTDVCVNCSMEMFRVEMVTSVKCSVGCLWFTFMSV